MGIKTALITGAAGLIGRHFERHLIASGWGVSAIDPMYDSYFEFVAPASARGARDAREFFQAIDRQFDLVIHCAAHVGGRLDIEHKKAYIGAYNVQLDGAMFEWALHTRPAHIVYWSSSAAYPIELQDEDRGELREEDIYLPEPQAADFTYGWAKLVGERLAAEVRAEGLNVTVLRPFSGWSDDQDTSYPVGAFLERARRREDPFTVWGDGEQVRDFIHVSDIVGATMAAVDRGCSGPMNLCTGVPTSFNELAELVCKHAGYSPIIKHDTTKPEGVRYRVGDPAHMHAFWRPKVALEDGIKAALA
jgi:nucleoside-diphosphate-sugar epimerase